MKAWQFMALGSMIYGSYNNSLRVNVTISIIMMFLAIIFFFLEK